MVGKRTTTTTIKLWVSKQLERSVYEQSSAPLTGLHSNQKETGRNSKRQF